MRALTIYVFLSILFFSGFGQSMAGKISGSVGEASGKPIEAVSVSLNQDSVTQKTVLTDKSGQFRFGNIPAGKYILTLTHIGYTGWSSQPLLITAAKPVISLNTIVLQPAGASLGQVTVIGQRPPIENKIDKMVVNVDASPTNGGLNALEVLEKSPGVTVDNDGKVSLKGKAGVIIMIDGKPTYLSPQDLSNYLKNMPANLLDQVEIMSQPPAKYDAAGNSGIINIITKKNKNNGFNASINLSAIIARYFKSPNSISFNWRQGKVNVYGNYGYSYWEGFNDLKANNSLRESRNVGFDRYSIQSTYGRFHDYGHTFRAGVDYFADKQTTFGVSVNGTVDKSSFISESTTDFYDSLHRYVQYNVAQSMNRTPETHLGFNANMTRKLDNRGSEISVDGDYIFYDTKGTLNSNNYLFNADKVPSDNPYLLNGLLPSLIDIYTIKSDYKKVLGNDITFEAGLKSSYVTIDNNASYSLYDNTVKAWVFDTLISNHFIYKENINAAYVNWQQKIKKLSLQVGLRAEQTNTRGDQTVKSISFRQHYFQLFPTTYLNYKVNDDNTFGVSYGRRIERPSYQNLNPFRFQQDRYTYEQGNPNLQPQYSNNIEISYNYKGELNVSANYSKTTNIISDAVINFKEAGDSNYTTYQTTRNIASERNIGLSLNYSKQLTTAWTINAFVNVYNHRYMGQIDSNNIDVSYGSFNANFNSQYRFKKGWSGEISGWYSGKDYISGVVLAEGRGMFSLGASKSIWNGKGSVKLNLRDPFYLLEFNSHTDLNKGLTHTVSRWDNRRVIFSFVYRFGKTTGGQQQRRGGSASDEQSRVGGNGQQ